MRAARRSIRRLANHERASQTPTRPAVEGAPTAAKDGRPKEQTNNNEQTYLTNEQTTKHTNNIEQSNKEPNWPGSHYLRDNEGAPVEPVEKLPHSSATKARDHHSCRCYCCCSYRHDWKYDALLSLSLSLTFLGLTKG